MKYADMKLSKGAPAKPAAEPRIPKRVLSTTQASFRLFRVENAAPNRGEYSGNCVCRHCGKTNMLEADVVENELRRKFFEGTVYAADMKALVRDAKVSGDSNAIPTEVLDLVDQAEAAPFDDSLERV